MKNSVYASLNHLACRARIVLNSNILPFWKQQIFDKESQLFAGYVDQRGNADLSYPLHAVLLTRMLWAYSAVYEQHKDAECLSLAHAAYKTLLQSFKDQDFGGIYYSVRQNSYPLVMQKRTFAQAFSIIALARYARATNSSEALSEAKELNRLLLLHAQTEKGGFTDTLSRDWCNENDEHIWWLNNQGSMFIYNSQLHMLEAAIEIEEASPSEEGKQQLKAQIAFILDWFLLSSSNHLIVSLSDQHHAADTTVSFSNELETAYLLRRAAALAGEQDKVDHICTTLVRNVINLALDEVHGGLFFSYHEQNGLNRCKVWYVHAEAIVALLDAFEFSGDLFFLTNACTLWEYIEEHLIDWNGGEWFASAKNPYTDVVSLQQQEARDRRTGKEKASAYKCPYHTVRACLEIEKRVSRLKALFMVEQ